MAIAGILDALGKIGSTRLAVPLALPDRLSTTHRECFQRLPAPHRELITLSNGVTAYHGFYRLFGLGAGAVRDMVAWNDEATWKFAWDDRLSPYWSLGESPWGDQYVYRMSDLNGNEPTPVFVLEAFSMYEKSFRWPSFTDFLEQEFVRCASQPWDSMARAAYEKLGKLDIPRL